MHTGMELKERAQAVNSRAPFSIFWSQEFGVRDAHLSPFA